MGNDAVQRGTSGGGFRRWAYNNLFIGSLERMARGLRHWPSNRPERHGVEVIRDVRYLDGDEPAHTLDVYRPAGAEGPLPVCLYIHGGGFQFFSRETHWAMAQTFARQGFLTINIDYRLAPTHPYPAAFHDAAAALIWAVENAAEYGGDVSRMVWAGESAGGNLVLALTYAACWPSDERWARLVWEADVRPRVLLPACGYLQVAQPERLYEGKDLPGWMKDRMHVVSDAYLPDHATPRPEHAFANPLLSIADGGAPHRPFPPTFALVGTRDPTLRDTRRLGEVLTDLDVPHQVEFYEGGIHAFHAMRWKPLAQQAWADQLAFVDTWLDQAPAVDAAAGTGT